jgi:hypothetical protein
MKKFPAFLCVSLAIISNAIAGTTTVSGSKDTAAPQPCPSWFADREWNVSLWGAYAFTSNDYPTLQNSNPLLVVPDHDTYLEADHAWGGGIDAKYFFARYFGIGVEGYVLDVRQSFPDVFINFFDIGGGRNFARTSHDRRAIGSILGTLTLRYPLGCSRFAPYVFVGGGAIFGGGQVSRFDTTSRPDIEFTSRSGSEAKLIGQFGGGFEVRLTPHIGFINDFTWNVVDGSKNNFGMARTGVNFSF